MLKIGITGGIGSGKTTVCTIFEKLGVPVFNADAVAKSIIQKEERVVEQIKKIFGSDIYFSSGELDRKKLASIVFSNKQKLAELNNILHPATIKAFNDWHNANTNALYILKEAAILFESGTHKGLDAVITVTAPLELKIQRVIKRDGVTREQVLERMHNQMSDEEKIKLSKFVIYNDEEQLVIPQVLSIHQQLIATKA